MMTMKTSDQPVAETSEKAVLVERVLNVEAKNAHMCVYIDFFGSGHLNVRCECSLIVI